MTDVSGRLAQALADRYRIERQLGQGGMATVYLAEDLKHDRKVAIKVLRPELAAVLGAERFVQEIKTTAQLQHPHILPLFDSGQADGFLYYVMPYIEGETLRSKLDREKQLGIDESVQVTREVADALDYAHRHGVIHRDIKPENILIHDGRPTVADFGIALAVSAAAGGRLTETGLSLGTPHYMSPEQATAEKELTNRSDIYSLGSVLYEMLTGNPPHTGASAQQIIMKIVTEEAAPVTQLRRNVPPHVAAAVAKAIEKLPGDRFETARAFATALGDPAYRSTARRALAKPVGWRRYTGGLIAGLAVIAIAGVAMAIRPRPDPSSPVSRFVLALPPSQVMAAPGGTLLAWSPDSRSFLYVGTSGEGTQLWRRSLDALEATPLPGTDGATSPFVSPDGTRIGFITFIPFSVRLLSADGKSASVLVKDSVSGGGAAWADDGYIYFDGVTGLSRIRPDGTGRELVYTLDPRQHEVGVAWPEALPGGRSVLFRVRHAGDAVGDYQILGKNLRTGEVKVVVQALIARYAPTGHLLFVTGEGALMGARFDPERLQVIGTPVLLARPVSLGGFGVADVALSRDGSLLYSTGNSSVVEPVWVTRAGAATPVDTAWPNGLTNAVSLSPDGSQLAFEFISSIAASAVSDIWVKRVAGGPLTRLTFGRNNVRPSWSGDGRDIVYLGDQGTSFVLMRQRSDGSEPARAIAPRLHSEGEGFLSPDGAWVVFRSADAECCDILGLHLGIDTAAMPLLATPFRERSPALSPDGKWLAYTSDETGRFEVVVRPFPAVNGGKWQVSTGGGTSPRWSRNGEELFYRDGAGDMQAVQVRTRPTFALLGRQRLFSASGYQDSPWSQSYDVTPDGRRFVMLRLGPSGGGAASPVLVQNFLTELKQKVP